MSPIWGAIHSEPFRRALCSDQLMGGQAAEARDKEIIFVSNTLANGGAERVLCLLANSFAARGRRVGVLSYMRADAEYHLDEPISKSYCPFSGNSAIEKIRRIRWMRRIIKQNPGAVIVAFQYFVNMQALIACIGIPNRVIVSERNDPCRVGSGFPTDLIRKILYRRAAMLVCQTDEAAAYFSDKISKTVILNPLKPDLPQPVQFKRRKTVVTFCRLEKQKNLGMLVRAFAAFHRDHRDYTLEIYGNGGERAALVELVDSLSISCAVSILPARGDVHEVVRDCAMFVLPSDYEGFANSMIEAMALGLPTICSDCPCGGARMVIENGTNGLLVPVGDVKALTAAMSSIADDPDLALQIGAAGAKLREKLSLDQIADEWNRVMMESKVGQR